MERIVIEVADTTAKNWQNISPKVKAHLQQSFTRQIDEISQKQKEHNFEVLLDKIRDQAAQNGLTEEILQKLLNEE